VEWVSTAQPGFGLGPLRPIARAVPKNILPSGKEREENEANETENGNERTRITDNGNERMRITEKGNEREYQEERRMRKIRSTEGTVQSQEAEEEAEEETEEEIKEGTEEEAEA
jgi:hypothetical protein